MLTEMRKKIGEQGDVWQYLSSLNRPIVLYGMGDGADKILKVCGQRDIRINDIFASDDFVRGQSFHGQKVMKFLEIVRKYDDFTIVLGFSTARQEVLKRIFLLGERYDVVAPDVPLYGDKLFTLDYYDKHAAEFSEAYSLFEDEFSRTVYRSVLYSKLTGRLSYMSDAVSENEEIQELLSLDTVKNYVDLGAYRGDTIQEMKRCSKALRRVWAFEPDERNYRKLEAFAELQENMKIHTYQMAAWFGSETLIFESSGNRNAHAVLSDGSDTGGRKRRLVRVQAASVDDILQGETADYIKYDVEGAEREALLGSRNTISFWRPRLLVSAYHRASDLFELPLLLHEICPSYRLILRKTLCIPAWDVSLLCTEGSLIRHTV